MFGMRHPKRRDEKRQRESAIVVESLEDRVVLSAAVAEVEIQYLRAINHVNGLLQGHVNRVTSTLTRQVSRLDAQYEATLSRTASRMESGSVVQVQKARVDLSRATARVDAKVDQLLVKVDQQDNAFTASFDRKLAGVTGRYGRLNATVRSANPYFQSTFRGALNTINGAVAAAAQGAQAAVQDTTGLVDAAIAQAGTDGTPAVSAADVASGQLAVVSQSQVAAVQASIAQFRNQFYSTFTPYRAEMAALASAQLPPISLAGAGHGTGLDHAHGSSNKSNNGTGTGTVTFTGLPGAEGTTGSGTGDEDGVGGTGSTGAGAGTTSIDGTSTNTTGVGATITAGIVGNSNNGVGATTGTAGTTTTGSPMV